MIFLLWVVSSVCGVIQREEQIEIHGKWSGGCVPVINCCITLNCFDYVHNSVCQQFKHSLPPLHVIFEPWLG